jgi:membrane-bound lytic murein transglycosylase A
VSAAFHKYLVPAAWPEAPLPLAESLHKTHALFRVIPPDGQSRFTGYFEPVLKGSYACAGPYRYPVYRAPEDLVSVPNFEGSNQPGLRAFGRMENGKIAPHFSRAEIENGALQNKNLELLFVDDPVALFFLHVQGSGKIILPDGAEIRLRFAGKNGRPYTAIGGVLQREESLAPITMQTITDFLRAHPEKIPAILNRNASYIFFETLEGAGPIGADGAVLEAEKSLAIDDTIWPYGFDVIVETRDPIDPQKPLVLLMKTQDCGSAIRGPARGDIFFGSGDAAGKKAGAMNAPGSLWIILPRA